MMKLFAFALAVVLCFATALTYALTNPKSYSLTFYLNRVNSDAHIDNEFISRSTPGNKNFRQWLSKEQVTDLFRASDDTITAATELAQSVCSTPVKVSNNKDMLHCRVSSDKKAFAHIQERFAQIGNDVSPSVEIQESFGELRNLNRLTTGVIAYRATEHGRRARVSTSNGVSGEPGMTQTPGTINKRYNVPRADTLKLDRSLSVGVAEYENSYFKDSDLEMFQRRYGTGKFNVKVLGPNKPGFGAGSVEGTLDLEYITQQNNATLPTYWLAQSEQNGGGEPGEIDWARWADTVADLSASELPGVISISWGLAEKFYNNARRDMTAGAMGFKKLGLRGITVFAASGDSGPGDRRPVFDCRTFLPSYPASAPTLTTVGATFANTESDPEQTVPWSGGGFSDQFSMQDWQKDAVENYIKTASNMPPAHLFNHSGRAYPDVSALGTNFMISVNGQWMQVSGTSAASPTFAGVVGLIASERKAAGKPMLGFLNPAIYKAGKVGFDVTIGATKDATCIPAQPGFPCARGWDAATGLGTPEYNVLKSYLFA